ncbi:hypothetical protein A2763_00390 [Candidatus Kaiserbacteria bacterium RIFCSPHIGHO2_01_FULL_54_36]|uniref:SMC-Scp complex subunit ScpB n=1 Tax=Candidatus Kaiserbacteria bacterium RIFCSPHIGHO2_01_FULL_54_36 TaxID=1798482 RepID=A0A1F6CN53_9BACT|nr:MAG: hypothetical protein A2763_00390 [Candidatus Kaiserbacteria bacterium RIFCSPHIGHO2_01_FULL_54_36]OGG75704.1 MAG: hypothetical protein A3A41_04245 [Candidatus Kaiserbacteria bacterium RIFCSPLOWO2_01_FULL_54_22]
MSDLTNKIQAFLFSEGGSLTLRKLMSHLEVQEPELRAALDELQEHLEGSGLTLIRSETEATLAVSSQTSAVLQKAYQAELGREIGDAGLEVLAIVLYRGPSTRSQIDYIRGVHTSSTIRTMLARGLLERTGNPEDGREYFYRPTVELLSHLGVRRVEELPNYQEIVGELAAFESAAAQETDVEMPENAEDQ